MTHSTAPAPAVSVVIPAYNVEWCVGRAVESVLAQTFRDFEVIVVDDGSTDDTAKVLQQYGAALRVVRKSNGGLSSARNAGIAAAGGEMVAFLDADDWWLPAKLERQVDLMRRRPEVGFCSTAASVVDPDDRVINVWRTQPWHGPFLVHLFGAHGDVAGSGSAVMARRHLLDKVGGFDEALRSLEDIDMWMRLASEAEYASIDEALVVILKHPDSMSRNLEVMRISAVQVMQKNRHLLPGDMRGAYWRQCLAGVYADYAKWRYRSGARAAALADVLRALWLSPLMRGRLALGLMRDMVCSRSL